METKQTNIVKCCVCGKEHNAQDATYLTLEGHLYVGSDGGILNNCNICFGCLEKVVKDAGRKLVADKEKEIEHAQLELKELMSNLT